MRGKFAGAAIAVVLMVCSAVGQSTFGSIVGVVHDTTQAVVPETAGGPGFGLPGGDGAVLTAGDFDLAESAGTVPGNLQFGGAIEEDLDRLAISEDVGLG